MDDFKQQIRSLLEGFAQGLRELPGAAHTPGLIRYWLWGHDKRHTLICLAVLLSPLVLAPAAGGMVSIVFPATKSKELLGFIRQQSSNPLHDTAMLVTNIAVWALALFVSMSMLLGRLRHSMDTFPLKSLPSSSSSADSTIVVGTAPDGPGAASASSSGIGRYETGDVLGHGAMGVVFRAHDTRLGRDVALKELPGSLTRVPSFVERFRREARVLARLSHPGIVQVYDLVEEDERIWIVMELVEGGDLAGLIRDKALEPGQASGIGAEVLEAMDYAHLMGIVHRDLKPSNILMTPEGRPKVTDFGLARLSEGGELTQAGSVLGSPYYLSPEQACGQEADSRSDIYCLGAMLYELYTGEVPFKADNIQGILRKHLEEEPVPPKKLKPRLPKAIDELIVSMLIKDPDKRASDLKKAAGVLKKHSG